MSCWTSCLPRKSTNMVEYSPCLTVSFFASDPHWIDHYPQHICPLWMYVDPFLLSSLCSEISGSKKIGAFLVLFVAGFLAVMIAVPILAFDCQWTVSSIAAVELIFWTDTRLPSWPGPCIGIQFSSAVNSALWQRNGSYGKGICRWPQIHHRILCFPNVSF